MPADLVMLRGGPHPARILAGVGDGPGGRLRQARRQRHEPHGIHAAAAQPKVVFAGLHRRWRQVGGQRHSTEVGGVGGSRARGGDRFALGLAPTDGDLVAADGELVEVFLDRGFGAGAFGKLHKGAALFKTIMYSVL